MSADGIEFRLVGHWCRSALGDFFEALRAAGDEALFSPHPLTREHAASLAAYAGRDLYYVAVAGGSILGYGMLRGWDEGFAVPSLGIAIHPDSRGSGLGRAMMAVLHLAARRRGAGRIRLKVHEQNEHAANLYRSLGYEFSECEGDQLVGYLELA
jgi:ribosomal-protein-alanine N-acetyltransferase